MLVPSLLNTVLPFFFFASETFKLFYDTRHSLCFMHMYSLIREKIAKLEKMNFALIALGLLIAG